MIKVVFAYAPGLNGNAFGNADSLPWPHQKDDLSMFKEATSGSVCLMGCKTWESMPKSLPNRINVVLARPYLPENKAGEVPDMVMHGDLVNAINDLQTSFPDKDICVIGGLSVIDEALDFADEVIVTRLEPRDVRGFPATTFVPESTIAKIYANRVVADSVVVRYTEEENSSVHSLSRVTWSK